jgi:hypothetical protein
MNILCSRTFGDWPGGRPWQTHGDRQRATFTFVSPNELRLCGQHAQVIGCLGTRLDQAPARGIPPSDLLGDL